MMEEQQYVDLKISTKIIRIPVDPALYERYQLQFCRNKPSTAQRQMFWTLKALMRDAYLKGIRDGKTESLIPN